MCLQITTLSHKVKWAVSLVTADGHIGKRWEIKTIASERNEIHSPQLQHVPRKTICSYKLLCLNSVVVTLHLLVII